MKLILFTYDFPPSTGGIARLCYEIVKGSHHKYSEITVLAPNTEHVADTYEDLKCNIVKFINDTYLMPIFKQKISYRR